MTTDQQAKVEKIEINTLIKGAAEPKVISVNGKDYTVKIFSPDEKQDLYAYISDLILELRDTYGPKEFRFFNPNLFGDILVVIAVLGKKKHSTKILDIISMGLAVDRAWFSDNNIYGENIWNLFNGILQAQGIDLFSEDEEQKKNCLLKKV